MTLCSENFIVELLGIARGADRRHVHGRVRFYAAGGKDLTAFL
jgi:hypothetical protein